MSRRASDSAQMRRRAAGGAIQIALWTLAALGSVSVLSLATVSGLTELHIPKTTSFLGHLEDTAQVHKLYLPKGIAVELLMVRDGMRVTEGQTLVRLDPQSIATAIRKAEANASESRQVLACLNAALLSFSPMFSEGGARPALPVLTAKDCNTHTESRRRAIKALDASDAIWALRSELIDRRIKLELAILQSESTERARHAGLILGLAWEQTRIEGIHADNLKLREKMKTEAAAALAEDTHLAAATLHRAETDLAILAQLQLDPNLVSPADSIVLKTEPIAHGKVFNAPFALISMVPSGDQRFVVHTSVPASKEPSLTEDAIVRIELIGKDTRLPPLTGHVISVQSGMTLKDDAMWQVRIALEPESAAILAEVNAHSSFLGNNAPVEVKAVGLDQTLAVEILMILGQILPEQM